MVGWYFGATDPVDLPSPICVGGHMADGYDEADLIRALVHGGQVIQVTLKDDDMKISLKQPRFGSAKCQSGDGSGRWINMEDRPCAPPYCTGNRMEAVNHGEAVSMQLIVPLQTSSDSYDHKCLDEVLLY
jgi:hypothetical protein